MDPGTDSPPLRSTILGSFLRGRPRGASQSHTVDPNRHLSPSPPIQTAPPIVVSQPHRTPSGQPSPAAGLSNMLRRRRSAGNVAVAATATPPAIPSPILHRIRLVPHLDSRRSLRFDPIARDLREADPVLRIGRFTDRSGLGLAAVNALGSNKLAFRSKVVSRAHAEIWVESGGRFFIRDTKSSSGTFLNHVRLSPANTESRPYQIRDGDILQLGVDYQGGTEDIYKSVKIKVEIGREWQSGANAFNTNALKNLKTLAVAPAKSTSKPGKSSIPDCCICLFAVSIRQALFIAPCSHTFHYKCLRPLLEAHHPAFSCPLCRTFADLEEDVEVECEEGEEGEESAVEEGAGETESENKGSQVQAKVTPLIDLAENWEEEEDVGIVEDDLHPGPSGPRAPTGGSPGSLDEDGDVEVLDAEAEGEGEDSEGIDAEGEAVGGKRKR